MRFHNSIEHVPGKSLHTADTLSRAPLHDATTTADTHLEEDTCVFVNHVLESLPACDKRLEELRVHQLEDEICQQLMLFCRKGWPDKSSLKGLVKLYQPFAAERNIHNGLILKGCGILVPSSMRSEILDKIHDGHQGITKCRARARESVWWPGMSRQIEELVQNCGVCCKHTSNKAEPMIASELPQLPWQKVASDLFEIKGQKYLLVVD